MTTLTIDIAKDFSKYPSGRLERDGLYSGEEFRKKHLIPALKNNDKVIVVLDGVTGYPLSFTIEAFGGLVRTNHFDKEEILSKLDIKYTSQVYESYALDIKEAIRAAVPQSK